MFLNRLLSPSPAPPASPRASRPRQTRWSWRRARAPLCRSPSWPPLQRHLLCPPTRETSRPGRAETDLRTEQTTATTSGWIQCRYGRWWRGGQNSCWCFRNSWVSCKSFFTVVWSYLFDSQRGSVGRKEKNTEEMWIFLSLDYDTLLLIKLSNRIWRKGSPGAAAPRNLKAQLSVLF